jgi:hypothetical protein
MSAPPTKDRVMAFVRACVDIAQMEFDENYPRLHPKRLSNGGFQDEEMACYSFTSFRYHSSRSACLALPSFARLCGHTALTGS